VVYRGGVPGTPPDLGSRGVPRSGGVPGTQIQESGKCAFAGLQIFAPRSQIRESGKCAFAGLQICAPGSQIPNLGIAQFWRFWECANSPDLGIPPLSRKTRYWDCSSGIMWGNPESSGPHFAREQQPVRMLCLQSSSVSAGLQNTWFCRHKRRVGCCGLLQSQKRVFKEKNVIKYPPQTTLPFLLFVSFRSNTPIISHPPYDISFSCVERNALFTRTRHIS